MKVWDISRQTYRQTTTLRHSSTPNCIDVGIDSFTAVSAHLDGGIRFWDVRTGERTADISRKFCMLLVTIDSLQNTLTPTLHADLHEGAITSVQFHPTDSSKVLTNGMDSCLKIVDIRTCTAIQTLRNAEFQTSYGWSSSSFSPDGRQLPLFFEWFLLFDS
jgi:WD40 repeat protein